MFSGGKKCSKLVLQLKVVYFTNGFRRNRLVPISKNISAVFLFFFLLANCFFFNTIFETNLQTIFPSKSKRTGWFIYLLWWESIICCGCIYYLSIFVGVFTLRFFINTPTVSRFCVYVCARACVYMRVCICVCVSDCPFVIVKR